MALPAVGLRDHQTTEQGVNMHIEMWLVVVMAILAVIGAVSMLRAGVRYLRQRREIAKAMPLLMELTGKSEVVLRAELRGVAKQQS